MLLFVLGLEFLDELLLVSRLLHKLDGIGQLGHQGGNFLLVLRGQLDDFLVMHLFHCLQLIRHLFGRSLHHDINLRQHLVVRSSVLSFYCLQLVTLDLELFLRGYFRLDCLFELIAQLAVKVLHEGGFLSNQLVVFGCHHPFEGFVFLRETYVARAFERLVPL